MFKGSTYTGDEMKKMAKMGPPLGGNFKQEKINQADSLEIWHTSFSDGGDDYSEFRLMKGKTIIEIKRIGGY